MNEFTIGIREGGINNLEWGPQRKMKLKNKIKTSGTEKCANIEILYINEKNTQL